MITISCAACATQMNVPETFAGRKWTCGVCGAKTPVSGHVPPRSPFPDPLSTSRIPLPTSGKAIASLVLGLLTLFGPGMCVTGILGIIVGWLALEDIHSGASVGRGMARTGIALSVAGMIIPMMFMIAWFALGLWEGYEPLAP
jgi:hypothetical protein